MLAPLLRLSSALLLCAPLATAGVLTVDPSGDANAAFQAAVDAAADGDTLVLLPGDYSFPNQTIYIQIVGKGLTIVPAAGAHPAMLALYVADLPAGSQLVIRGLDIGPTPDGYGLGAITAMSCAGGIWIEDCSLRGFDAAMGAGFFDPVPGVSGVFVLDCEAVNFVRCDMTGGMGAPEDYVDTFHPHPASRGGHGAHVIDSSATFYDCTLKGGVGGKGKTSATGKEGGSGLYVKASHVLLAGGSATGGDKAPFSLEPGDGVHVEADPATVFLRGATIAAGVGPPAAQDVDAPVGAVTVMSAPPRSLEISSPLHEGQAGTLVIGGQPGDLTAIFMAFHGGALLMPGKQGVFALGSPFFGPFLLAVNPTPTGQWTIPFTAGPLVPAALTEQTFLLQLVVHDGSQLLIEGGTAYVLLDSSVP